MKAIFPGQCAICNGAFVRGEPIADSGKRGPRGGKKMAHVGCVGARSNPYPRRGGMAIPGDYPDSDYQYGPDPQMANWTSYPQYSYESFYRTNPAPRARRNFFGFGKKAAAAPVSPEVTDLQEDIKQLKLQIAGAPRNSDLWFDLMGELNVVERRLEKLLSGARRNPSAAASRPVYQQMPDNAGPYLPEMFPYGQGGRPASYEPKAKKAKKNPGGWGINVLEQEDGFIRFELPKNDRDPRTTVEVRTKPDKGKVFGVTVKSRWEEEAAAGTPEEIFSRAAEMSEDLERWSADVWDRNSRMTSSDRAYYRARRGLVEGLEQAAYVASAYKPSLRSYYLLSSHSSRALRNRGKRSAFLKPSSGSWPVGDRKHAKIAVQYMTRGFGNPAEYPALIKRLADQYPVEDSANRAVWAAYRKNLKGIESKAGRAMPSMKSLRRRAAR